MLLGVGETAVELDATLDAALENWPAWPRKAVFGWMLGSIDCVGAISVGRIEPIPMLARDAPRVEAPKLDLVVRCQLVG